MPGCAWCLSHTPQVGVGLTGLQSLTTQCGQSFQSPWNWTFCSTGGHCGSIFNGGAKTACSSRNKVQKEESLSNHPEKRTLRDQAKRTRTKQHAVGRGHSLSLALVLPGGVLRECFPPDSLSAPGVCAPRLYGL